MDAGSTKVCIFRADSVWSDPGAVWAIVRDDPVVTAQGPSSPHTSTPPLAGMTFQRIV